MSVHSDLSYSSDSRILENVEHGNSNDLRDGFIVSIIGMAFILLLMVAIWMLSNTNGNRRYFCCCFRRNVITSSTVRVPQVPRISSSRRLRRRPPPKTGLAGLTVKERHAVLEHLFAGNAYSKDSHPLHDVENPSIETSKGSVSDAETTESTDFSEIIKDQELSCEAHPPKNDQTPIQEASITVPNGMEEVIDEYDSGDDDATCAICLMDYTDGEMVLNGRSCRHRFHRDCVMEWLDKHDHCPFCREEMMTSSEFKEAAIATLGQERIQELCIDSEDQTPIDNDEAQTETDEGDTSSSETTSNHSSTNTETESAPPPPPPSRYYDY